MGEGKSLLLKIEVVLVQIYLYFSLPAAQISSRNHNRSYFKKINSVCGFYQNIIIKCTTTLYLKM